MADAERALSQCWAFRPINMHTCKAWRGVVQALCADQARSMRWLQVWTQHLVHDCSLWCLLWSLLSSFKALVCSNSSAPQSPGNLASAAATSCAVKAINSDAPWGFLLEQVCQPRKKIHHTWANVCLQFWKRQKQTPRSEQRHTMHSYHRTKLVAWLSSNWNQKGSR